MITAPGVYEHLDIDLYHSQACCDGPSISSSGLRTILRECPARYYAFSDLNPHRFVEEAKHVFAFGRAAHALTLGEPAFAEKFVLSPYDDFRSKAAQQWRDEQTRQVVKAADMQVIRDMVEAQLNTPAVARAFISGRPEISLIWKDAETGIWLKSRPDWLPDAPASEFTIEYKTCATIQPRQLSNSVFSFAYEAQAALTLDAIQIVMDVKPLGIAHVVQEKDPPYLCDLRMFSDEQIDFGRREYRKALRIFARCLETNTWPAYTSAPSYFDTPRYIETMMETFDDNATDSTGNEYSAADYLSAG